MHWTYNAKVAAVKLKHLSGSILSGGGWGSLLRCNYYHEYLACEEEDLWTIHITWSGLRFTVWGTLSYFVENCCYSLTALERRSHFRSMSHLASENKSIYHLCVYNLGEKNFKELFIWRWASPVRRDSSPRLDLTFLKKLL